MHTFPAFTELLLFGCQNCKQPMAGSAECCTEEIKGFPTGEPSLDYFQCFLCIVIIRVTVWASQEGSGSLEEIHSSVPSLIRVCRKC